MSQLNKDPRSESEHVGFRARLSRATETRRNPLYAIFLGFSLFAPTRNHAQPRRMGNIRMVDSGQDAALPDETGVQGDVQPGRRIFTAAWSVTPSHSHDAR